MPTTTGDLFSALREGIGDERALEEYRDLDRLRCERCERPWKRERLSEAEEGWVPDCECGEAGEGGEDLEVS